MSVSHYFAPPTISTTNNNNMSNNNNNSNRSHAMDIAVDAHATRLLRAHSPPEACVDSSLGPYVTSILREALELSLSSLSPISATSPPHPHYPNKATNTNKWRKSTIHHQIPDYDSLIELLESQCHISSPVIAKNVIWEIAMAVQTGEVVSDHHECGGGSSGSNNNGGGHFSFIFENQHNGIITAAAATREEHTPPLSTATNCTSSNSNTTMNTSRLGRGYRSKSLGAEQEYDVHFLGKILQDAMSASSPTVEHSSHGLSAAVASSSSSFTAVVNCSSNVFFQEQQQQQEHSYGKNNIVSNNDENGCIVNDGGMRIGNSFSSNLTMALESDGHANDGGSSIITTAASSTLPSASLQCCPSSFPASSASSLITPLNASSSTSSSSNNTNNDDTGIDIHGPLFIPPLNTTTTTTSTGIGGGAFNFGSTTPSSTTANSAFAPRRNKERHVSFDETHLNTYSYLEESGSSAGISTGGSTNYNNPPLGGSYCDGSSSTTAGVTTVTSTSTSGACGGGDGSLVDVRDAPQAQLFVPLDYFDPLEGVLNILNLEEDDEEEEDEEEKLEIANVQNNGCETKSGETNHDAKHDNVNAKDGNSVTTSRGTNDFLQCQPVSSTRSNPELSVDAPHATKKLSRKQQKSSKKEANDLAAALFFRPSRPRSNSLMDQRNRSSPPLRPLAISSTTPSSSSCGPGLLSLSIGDGTTSTPSSSSSATSVTSATTATTNFSSTSSTIPNNSNKKLGISAVVPHDNNAAVTSTTQLLLTLNAHLGHEAATLASQLTEGDLNLAQYLIEAARSDTSSGGGGGGGGHGNRRRPRICRHELHGTCYRSDCPYSHDLGGVTCLFWLRGRCRGGSSSGDSSCRFLHGFGERLMDGICEEYLIEQKAKRKKEEQERVKQQLLKQQEEEEKKNAIQTTNLLHHNEWAAADRLSSSLPNKAFTFLPPPGRGSRSSSPVFGNGCWTASVANR